MKETFRLAHNIIDALKKTNITVDFNNEKMPLLAAFLNDFGKYLALIAGCDSATNPICPEEAKYIIDVARIRMNIETLEYVSQMEELKLGGEFRKELPKSIRTIIENEIVKPYHICKLYASAAMELILADGEANDVEIKTYNEYADLFITYFEESVPARIYARCRDTLEYTQYLQRYNMQKSADEKSGIMTHLRAVYADVFMNCDVRANPEKTGADNLTKILDRDIQDYVIALASIDGNVTAISKVLLDELIDYDMTMEEIQRYALEKNILNAAFSQKIPEVIELCVSAENFQRSMQKVMPNKRIKNMNIGTAEKLAKLYTEIGICMGAYSDDESVPNMDVFKAIVCNIREYLKNNLHD